MKSDLFSLSAVYTRMIFRSWFQYKIDAILRSLAVFMREATAIIVIFFTGLRDFGNTVRSGGFDRYILRPRGLLYQLIFANADWFAAVGQGGLGIVLFIISASKVGVVWTPLQIVYYILTITGGVLIQGAIFMYITPLVGLVMYLLAYAFWRFSIKYYKSSGN